jgi:membrane associated rhomboid family serine protease
MFFPLRDTIASRSYPLVNYLIILLCSFLFLLEITLEDNELVAFIYTYGFIPSYFLDADYRIHWAYLSQEQGYIPLLACMFLHSGWLHIISNMWMLYIFGDNVEDRMGKINFLIFYLLAGLVATFTHTFMNPGSTLPIVGASGAIAGVMGAYMFMYPQSKIESLFIIFFYPIIIDIPAFTYLGIWFLIELFNGSAANFFSNAPSQPIAFWAHIGGFVFGALFHKAFIASSERYWQ